MTSTAPQDDPTPGGRRRWLLVTAAAVAVVAVAVVAVAGATAFGLSRSPAQDTAAATTTTTSAPAPTSPPGSSAPTATAPTATAIATVVPTTAATTTATNPPTTAVAPSTYAPGELPPQVPWADAESGRYPRVWAVYLAVDADPTDPELATAVRQAADAGYEATDRSISCSSPGVEGVGVPGGYAFAALYFGSASDARRFVDAYVPGVVGTVEITLACNDGAPTS